MFFVFRKDCLLSSVKHMYLEWYVCKGLCVCVCGGGGGGGGALLNLFFHLIFKEIENFRFCMLDYGITAVM